MSRVVLFQKPNGGLFASVEDGEPDEILSRRSRWIQESKIVAMSVTEVSSTPTRLGKVKQLLELDAGETYGTP